MYSVVYIQRILVTFHHINMADRRQVNPSAVAAGQHLYSTDTRQCAAISNAQPTNGHVDFSFRKRFEKVDWRKIGMRETVF